MKRNQRESYKTYRYHWNLYDEIIKNTRSHRTFMKIVENHLKICIIKTEKLKRTNNRYDENHKNNQRTSWETMPWKSYNSD